MAVTTAPVGLRERKKERTRKTIIDVAIRLFAEQGYSETTLVQVAEAAEIAPSTFFKYFPTKAHIVFGLTEAVLESARTRLLERPAGETADAAILGWVANDLPEVEAPYAEALRQIPRIIAANPDLQAEERLRLALLEDVFAAAFARDFDEPAEGVRARVMAAVSFRGIVEVWTAWYAQHFADVDFDVMQVLALKGEYLERLLAAGLAAVQTLPAPPPVD
jgi:TetR/AcrR family transcriptional regulator, regulator of mycofactocin system